MSIPGLTNRQLNAIVLLRLCIGWHFFYEGVIKLFNPNWTAKFYLLSAEGFTKSIFVWLASDGMIGIVNILNIACLLLVGLALLLGIFERLGSIIGIGLLVLFYFAHPAFPGLEQAGTEGSYFIINKNIIEAAALYVLYLIPTGHYFGLSGYRKATSLNTAKT